MLRAVMRRRVACGSFLIFLVACQHATQVPVSTAVEPAKILGVRTVSGRDIRFKNKGALINRDTLYAMTDSGQLIMPLDSVKAVEVDRFSVTHTALLIVSLVAAFAIARNWWEHASISNARY